MARAFSLPASVRSRGPFAAWMALAAGLTIGSVVNAVVSNDVNPAVAVPVGLLMGATVALAWWRPLTAAALQVVVSAGQIPLHDPLYNLGVGVYTLSAVMGMGAARLPTSRVPALFGLGCLTIAAVLVPKTQYPVGDPIFALLFLLGLPTLFGRMFHSRAQLNAELRERARRLAVDRHVRSEEAAAQERRRIAGELHDLVAHGVSGMVVQAGAARRLVQTGDPRAAEAILAVEDSGREALAEVRRLLGVLRHDDRDLALAPQPSLSRVGALVAQMRESGLDVRLRVEGEQVRMSPGADVAGYRVVEEALRSALATGAAGPLEVVVTYAPGHVDLCVEGADPSATDLVGLRERLRLFGGELRPARRGAPPALRAHLPLDGVAA